MTREEKEQIGKYVLQMARLLEDGCYQQEMLLKAVHIIDEALEQEPTIRNCVGCKYSKDNHNAGTEECHLCMWENQYTPTTKNDLGVDWESYKDVDGNSLDDLILEVLQNNFDCGNTYGYKVADEIIELLPSVTPQEPQTFKWCTDCKEYDQEKHCCHRWTKVIRNTVEEMKQGYEREVLNQVRAEIDNALSDGMIHKKTVLGIIDKYKAESEEV